MFTEIINYKLAKNVSQDQLLAAVAQILESWKKAEKT